MKTIMASLRAASIAWMVWAVGSARAAIPAEAPSPAPTTWTSLPGKTPLDLYPPLDPLGLWPSESGGKPGEVFQYRFDNGQLSKSWMNFGHAANASLFSLSILGAFAPKMLPKGMRNAFQGSGRVNDAVQPPP
jgi:hypothetical protein